MLSNKILLSAMITFSNAFFLSARNFYRATLESKNVVISSFFSKNIFLKSQLKIQNNFLKLWNKYTLKVKSAIYRLVKRKLKKYLTVFVGGRFAVFNLFLPTSKPEVDENWEYLGALFANLCYKLALEFLKYLI